MNSSLFVCFNVITDSEEDVKSKVSAATSPFRIPKLNETSSETNEIPAVAKKKGPVSLRHG